MSKHENKKEEDNINGISATRRSSTISKKEENEEENHKSNSSATRRTSAILNHDNGDDGNNYNDATHTKHEQPISSTKIDEIGNSSPRSSSAVSKRSLKEEEKDNSDHKDIQLNRPQTASSHSNATQNDSNEDPLMQDENTLITSRKTSVASTAGSTVRDSIEKEYEIAEIKAEEKIGAVMDDIVPEKPLHQPVISYQLLKHC